MIDSRLAPRRLAGALVPAVLVAAAAGCHKKDPNAHRGQPPVPVKVAVVQRMDAPITVTASGVVDPMQTVAVQSQVSGALQEVTFREGDYVKSGQVLFRIDPRPLQAALAQSRAALARDMAQAEAARRNNARYQTLVREDYVAREEADQVQATALAAAATVEADRAAVAAAEVNLGYATIRAPIAGRTGALLVRAGNLVSPSSGPLVVINQLQPILVRFPILSQDLGLVQSAVATHPLPVTAVRSDSGSATEVGQLSFLDNAVDSLTGTVTGKAVFQNVTGWFWPGQLVFLTVKVGVQPGVLAVPSSAILTGQQGSYVYVIDPQKKTAATRNVSAGRSVGDLTIVSGVAAGEQVVTDGQSRLKPGSKVVISRGGGAGGPGSVATGGPAGSDEGTTGEVAAGNTGAGGGGGGGGRAGGGGGGGPGGAGGAGSAGAGGVTAGVAGARGGSSTAPARTGGAAASSVGAPTVTPTGARSGTGSGGAAPVAAPLPSSGGGGTRTSGAGGTGSAGGTRGATGGSAVPGTGTGGVGGAAGGAGGAGAGGTTTGGGVRP